jgi:hypothetical protein
MSHLKNYSICSAGSKLKAVPIRPLAANSPVPNKMIQVSQRPYNTKGN